jgi:predicted  nucleic acid-binding Zn-ribbon protein
MQPERASDIARLVQERDTARTALAAMAARAERAEQTVNAMADRFEGLVSRVTKAEAALRQANAA